MCLFCFRVVGLSLVVSILLLDVLSYKCRCIGWLVSKSGNGYYVVKDEGKVKSLI